MNEKESQHQESSPSWDRQLVRKINAEIKSLEFQLVMAGGNNFVFVAWGDITELKLWEKRP